MNQGDATIFTLVFGIFCLLVCVMEATDSIERAAWANHYWIKRAALQCGGKP